MKKAITNEDLLKKMDGRFEKIDHHFQKIDGRFEKMDERFEKMEERFEKMDRRFEKMDERFDELTIMSKMSFDDLESKVENNTHSITQLKETVCQTNDHLCRVELNNHALEVRGIKSHIRP